MNWRTIVPSREPAHLVKGTEIDVCIPDGFRSRFAVYGVRAYEANPDWTSASIAEPRYHATMHYHVRDAHRISDAAVKAGGRPPVIGTFETLDAALAFIEPARVVEFEDA